MLSLFSFLWVLASACRSARCHLIRTIRRASAAFLFFIPSYITCLSNKIQHGEVMTALREQVSEQEAKPLEQLCCSRAWASSSLWLCSCRAVSPTWGSEIIPALRRAVTAWRQHLQFFGLYCLTAKLRPLEALCRRRVPLSGAIQAGERGFGTPCLEEVCVFLWPGAGT